MKKIIALFTLFTSLIISSQAQAATGNYCTGENYIAYWVYESGQSNLNIIQPANGNEIVRSTKLSLKLNPEQVPNFSCEDGKIKWYINAKGTENNTCEWDATTTKTNCYFADHHYTNAKPNQNPEFYVGENKQSIIPLNWNEGNEYELHLISYNNSKKGLANEYLTGRILKFDGDYANPIGVFDLFNLHQSETVD